MINTFFSYSLYNLLVNKLNLPSIPTRSYREVEPVVTCSAVVLEDEFVEVLSALIADV